MISTRRAVIDIGTNSVKLLVAEVSGHHVRALCEESEQTRLGEGFYETHQLQGEAIHATAYFAAKFAELARANQAENIRIIATSAARDAVNQVDLLRAVEEKAGLKIEVISGEQEAELAFRGVSSDAALEGQRLCLLEVGGGSTQFTIGENERIEFARSFKLGAVRLLEQFPLSATPTAEERQRCRQWLAEFIARGIRPSLAPVLEQPRKQIVLVGVGSAAKALLRMETLLNNTERERLKAKGIPLATVSDWAEELWRMSLSERKRLVGLKKKRADVIPFGAAIFEAVMQELGFGHLRVSKRGLRHGAVLAPV
jgi:exopolyphosphatase / guanosine-5'-triphosphate,3'-diphosphate pyrophosphatase